MIYEGMQEGHISHQGVGNDTLNLWLASRWFKFNKQMWQSITVILWQFHYLSKNMEVMSVYFLLRASISLY